MTDTEQLFQDRLSPYFKVLSIMNVNHKPHPFMIGPRHVAYASDHYGGMLGEAAIEDAEKAGIYCYQTGCNVPYKEHTSDKALFLQLTADMTTEKAKELLQTVMDLMEKEKIDGFTFVETEEKYRFIL